MTRTTGVPVTRTSTTELGMGSFLITRLSLAGPSAMDKQINEATAAALQLLSLGVMNVAADAIAKNHMMSLDEKPTTIKASSKIELPAYTGEVEFELRCGVAPANDLVDELQLLLDHTLTCTTARLTKIVDADAHAHYVAQAANQQRRHAEASFPFGRGFDLEDLLRDRGPLGGTIIVSGRPDLP